ncbi:TetR/AcrR family transcriptional regulator [Nocardia gamkensis]|uniref:TetR/AcrR family transcriptional regulator n=1 Tax=Nocardia gamkensis TaxID=352869 RepID=UPI0036E761F9
MARNDTLQRFCAVTYSGSWIRSEDRPPSLSLLVGRTPKHRCGDGATVARAGATTPQRPMRVGMMRRYGAVGINISDHDSFPAQRGPFVSPRSWTPRRTAEQSRRRLEEAAIELFSRRGYDGTGTRDIAARAEVAERLIFRHYGGKDTLLEAALETAMRKTLDAYAERWSTLGRQNYELEEIIPAYVQELHALVRQYRRPLIDLLALQSGQDSSEPHPIFAPVFSSLQGLVDEEARRQSWSVTEARLMMRLVSGLIISSALLPDLLTSDQDPEPSESQLISSLTHLILHGAVSLPRTPHADVSADPCPRSCE